MAVRGNLSDASLPDVLQLLALGRKTGCLAVTDKSRFGSVYLDRGTITHASIVNRRDRLGDLLVRNGVVTPGTLAAAVDAQAAGVGKRLGEILMERGALTAAELERYIRLQIEEAIYALFTWTQGSFSFTAGERPEDGAMLVALHPESVLLEGARRVDEWALVEKKIPSLALVFGRADDAEMARVELTAEQRRVVPLLDGRRSVRDIVEASGLGEFEVGKALYGLIQAGLAHPRGRREEPEMADGGPRRVEEHRNLALAFYRSGMLEEAHGEFARLLELAPDDLPARFHLGLTELRAGRARAAARRFREVIERGGAWGAAFHDLSLALESLGRVEDALLALDEARRVLGGYPPLLLSRAILLTKAGRVWEAAEAFEAFRARLGEGETAPAVYYAFAMLAEGARGRLDAAAALAEEGVRLHPHVVPVLLHAGGVRERGGAAEEAEMLYRRAVEEDPGHPAARLALADALYRRGAESEAAEEYEALLAMAPQHSPGAVFRLGNLRYRQGARAEAVRLWRRTLEIDSTNALARTHLELVERTLSHA